MLLVFLTPVAMRRGYQFEVNFLGKLATWLLYLSLALTMIVHGDMAALDLLDGVRARRRSLVQYFRKARKEIGGGRGT